LADLRDNDAGVVGLQLLDRDADHLLSRTVRG
jgi:hypothetical protein